jgi:ferritin-like metal-binding protein YciE
MAARTQNSRKSALHKALKESEKRIAELDTCVEVNMAALRRRNRDLR